MAHLTLESPASTPTLSERVASLIFRWLIKHGMHQAIKPFNVAKQLEFNPVHPLLSFGR